LRLPKSRPPGLNYSIVTGTLVGDPGFREFADQLFVVGDHQHRGELPEGSISG